MTNIRFAVYGAGGFGREVKGLLQRNGCPFAGYIDDFVHVIEPASDYDDVLLAIADTHIRKQLIQQWQGKMVPFQSILSKDVYSHPSVRVGRGCIICPGVQLTVDISLGDFVIVNLNATIGHDVKIGDFCSLMPGVNISGAVTLQERVFVGTGATILQGLTVGAGAVIGAGAVVTRDVAMGQVVMGVPARAQKEHRHE